MAYAVKYRTTVPPFKGSSLVTIDILKKDYVGEITILRNSEAVLSMDDAEYFDPIRATYLELTIINNLANFFELDDLFTINEFEFQVKVYDATYTYLNGFIPCSIVEQQFLPKGEVVINVTNNLKRLNNWYPTLFTTFGLYRLIDIVKHCLSSTGLTLPIYINCKVAESAQSSTDTNTVFDTKYVYSDLFKANDSEWKNNLEILTSILESFDCFIYYWNEKWYIERVRDVGHLTTTTFTVYLTNDTMTTATETRNPLLIGNASNKLRFIETSQRLRYIPGKKQIKLSLEESARDSVTSKYFDPIDLFTGSNVADIDPNFFKWSIDDTTTHSLAYNYYGITNALIMHNENTASNGNPNGTVFDYIGMNLTPPLDIPTFYSSLCGVYCKFRAYIRGAGNSTILNVKARFRLPADFLNVATFFMSDRIAHPSNHIFFLRFFVRLGNQYIDDDWDFVVEDTPGVFTIAHCNSIVTRGTGNVNMAVIQKSITFADFTDPNNFMTDISTTLNLAGLGWAGNTQIVVGICELGYNAPTIGYNLVYYGLKSFIIGDINISVSQDTQDNVIMGTVNNNYVDVLEKKQTLYGSGNINILNAMYNDSTGITLSSSLNWYDNTQGTVSYLSLPKRIIQDLYQIYNSAKHEVTGDIFYASPLRPFSFVTIDNFTNKFIFSGWKWDIVRNIFKSSVLKEYVSDNNIT